MNAGIIEIDLHGMNCYQAKTCIDSKLRKINGSVYKIRLIHGYHGGSDLKNMIWDEYSNGRHPKVIKVKPGSNPGITELVMKEL
jgi:DNA-nicking Smr family endonuclease